MACDGKERLCHGGNKLGDDSMESEIREADSSLLLIQNSEVYLCQLNIVKQHDCVVVRLYRESNGSPEKWADICVKISPVEARRLGEALLRFAGDV